MTDIVIPSPGRPYRTRAESARTQFGSSEWVVPSTRRQVPLPNESIATGPLGGFEVINEGSDAVELAPGEAFIDGRYVARDTTTQVTFSSLSNGDTVAIAYQQDAPDSLLIDDGETVTAAAGEGSVAGAVVLAEYNPLGTGTSDWTFVAPRSPASTVYRPIATASLSVSVEANSSVTEGVTFDAELPTNDVVVQATLTTNGAADVVAVEVTTVGSTQATVQVYNSSGSAQTVTVDLVAVG